MNTLPPLPQSDPMLDAVAPDTKDTVTILFHLGSGQIVSLLTETTGPDIEAEEVAEELHAKLAGMERPGWLQVENIVVFSGAVSAIEVL